MAQLLILNKPFVTVGLETLNYTVPTGGAGVYSLSYQGTMPTALPTGDGAGSGTGLGSGAGGGANGFSAGGQGLGLGGKGLGFGTGSGYPQPPSYGSNETSGPAVGSGLVVTVNKNASPVFVSPVLTPTQNAMQFNANLGNLVATDVISVVLSSADGDDAKLNVLKSSIAINQGL